MLAVSPAPCQCRRQADNSGFVGEMPPDRAVLQRTVRARFYFLAPEQHLGRLLAIDIAEARSYFLSSLRLHDALGLIERGGNKMKWTTPRIVEIAVGLEINSYACAELK
jgi:coenzyme PQQ precursor peptide PqqA